MSHIHNIMIIGAGVTGISCAREVIEQGRSVRIVDKGRGIGGRMATRRVDLDAGTIRFDHGAQYLRPKTDDFAKALSAAGGQVWGGSGSRAELVGQHGMSGLARALTQDISVAQQIEITDLNCIEGVWHLTHPLGLFRAKCVVLTIPAPQAARLVGTSDPLSDALRNVVIAPSLTLMVAFPPDSPRPFRHRVDREHPLAWISQDSSKPGRGTAVVTWVAQAGLAFSATHLEQTPEAIAARMLPLLCDVIGADPGTALHVRAHRWRYAQTVRPLGVPFLSSADRSLYVGGDWCLGARAEHGWQSGRAIAQDILARTC